MKNAIAISTLILVALLGACGKSDTNRHAVEVTTIDNVVYVKNNHLPEIGTRKFTLQEELSIGNNTDDNQIFGRIRKLAIDSQENIYILDNRRNRIQVFDRKAKFLKTIGHKGEGPGEFKRIADIIVDEKNKLLHVLDRGNKKISCFHFDGSVHSEIKLKESGADRFFPAPGGGYILIVSFFDDNRKNMCKAVKYSIEGAKRLESPILKFTGRTLEKNGGLSVVMKTNFDPFGFFALSLQGQLVYGFSNDYKIETYDHRFNKVRVISRKKNARIAVTEDEKKETREALKKSFRKKGIDPSFVNDLELPDYYQVFFGLWVDHKGDVLVWTSWEKETVQIDLFNAEGTFKEIRSIQKPPDEIEIGYVFSQPVFYKDFIYAAVKDHDGMHQVKRYRLIEEVKE